MKTTDDKEMFACHGTDRFGKKIMTSHVQLRAREEEADLESVFEDAVAPL